MLFEMFRKHSQLFVKTEMLNDYHLSLSFQMEEISTKLDNNLNLLDHDKEETDPSEICDVIPIGRSLSLSVDDENEKRSALQNKGIQSDGGCHTKMASPKRTVFSRYKLFNPEIPSPMNPVKSRKDCYTINTFPRGVVVILNNKDFERDTGMSRYPRHGTDRDAEELVNLFLELGFVVHRYDDVNKKEMKKIMMNISKEDSTGMSCFICCILSHGEEGTVYATDGEVKLHKLTSLFHRSSWIGKPKIFLIQACQGSNLMESVMQADGGDTTDAPSKDNQKSKEYFRDVKITLPIEADFLFGHATVTGFYAWRHSIHGSWFIQTLCEVFRQHAHKLEIMQMFARVNARMALRRSKTTDKDTTGKRQMAQIMTQFRKDFYFCPPYGPLKSKESK